MWPELREQLFARMYDENDFASVADELDRMIPSLTTPEDRAEALTLRGNCWEELRLYDRAARDYETALSLLTEPSYHRYLIQLLLGTALERSGRTEEALQRYLGAVETSILDPTTSCASALRHVLRLTRERNLSLTEHDTCRRGISHGWSVLGLQGNPLEKPIAEAVEKLRSAETRTTRARDSA